MAESNPTQIPGDVPEDAVDELYGLPLDEFTPRRDELSKELRSAGNREAAAWVKSLRKPTAAAWLVNQLARTQRSDARGVLDSGDALRSAQERALAREGDRDELAGAAQEHAAAMRSLLSKAPGLLDSRGASPSGATLERAADTLRAIPLDDDARAGFAAGRLTREHRAAGLGFAGPGPAHTPAAKPKKAARQDVAAAKEAERRTEERARAQAALKEAKARQRTRERDVRAAEREVEKAQRQLYKAQAALARAREKEADAAAQLEEAQIRASGSK
jgi:hypothetical protein